MRKLFSTSVYCTLVVTFICFISLSACNTPILKSEPSALPKTEVVFQVTLLNPLEEGKGLYLEVLDEVTGLYFNPQRYEMARSSDTLFFVKVTLTIGSEISYRYARISESIDIEYNSKAEQISARRLFVSGPDIVQDTVAGWYNEPYSSFRGRLRGQILDQANQAPIPNMVVTAAGLTTTSSSDGTFILENVPTGTHNVTIFSKDGVYAPFQQYATVAEDATTPIFINMKKRDSVTVTFIVETPDDFQVRFPLKMAGSLSNLGHPFALLNAGAPNTATSLPVMDEIAKGKYRISLQLPSGAYLQYKYTLGDGFWNSELDEKGQFVIREWIVPSNNITIQDKVETFSSPGIGEVSFVVNVPEHTPGNDSIFVQLNPYDWMEPLPMIQTSLNQWEYRLYSPTHLISSTTYRFCRNGDCQRGLSGQLENDTFQPGSNPADLKVKVSQWQNLTELQSQSFVENGGVTIQSHPGLISGIELSPILPSTWRDSIENGLLEIKDLGTNWVIVSPRWAMTSTNPPMIEPYGYKNMDWEEIQWLVNHVKLQELTPVLFPQVDISKNPNFWIDGQKDGDWWQSYFDRYQRFILNYADLAEILDISALIIGDPIVVQYMQIAPDADERWLQLIADIRARFNGEIIGVIPIPSEQEVPQWNSEVDRLYVLFSPDLSSSNNYIETYGQQLDLQVYPLYERFSKPIIVGTNASSNANGIFGCLDQKGSCLVYNLSESQIDLPLQARIYNAAVVASYSRSWIQGLISREYYPFVKSTDTSASVNGKPAADVLWFWYHLVQNITP